jgi:hypothetical protein
MKRFIKIFPFILCMVTFFDLSPSFSGLEDEQEIQEDYKSYSKDIKREHYEHIAKQCAKLNGLYYVRHVIYEPSDHNFDITNYPNQLLAIDCINNVAAQKYSGDYFSKEDYPWLHGDCDKQDNWLFEECGKHHKEQHHDIPTWSRYKGNTPSLLELEKGAKEDKEEEVKQKKWKECVKIIHECKYSAFLQRDTNKLTKEILQNCIKKEVKKYPNGYFSKKDNYPLFEEDLEE